MDFTAFHIYFHSFLVKDDMNEILSTHEREKGLASQACLKIAVYIPNIL